MKKVERGRKKRGRRQGKENGLVLLLSTSCGGWKRRNEISWRDEVERDVRRRGEILFAWNSHSRLINMDEGREEREGERMKRKGRDEMKGWKNGKGRKRRRVEREGESLITIPLFLLFFLLIMISPFHSVEPFLLPLHLSLSLSLLVSLSLFFLFLSTSSSSSLLQLFNSRQPTFANISKMSRKVEQEWKEKRWEKRFNSVPLLSPSFSLFLPPLLILCQRK